MIIYLCMKYESNTPIFSKDIARKPFFVRTVRDVRTDKGDAISPPPIINGGGITTARLFQSICRDFDTNLVSWKKAVEEDVATEKRLQQQISAVTTEVEKGTLTSELNSHRDGIHPGYQFVGDNVDFIVKVRHMFTKHQNKDHHLFKCVSYKNRLADTI